MDAKLNIPDISALLSKRCDMPMAKAELFSKIFFDIIIEGLDRDGLVKINGIGTFKIIDVASRGSIDVNTGEKIEIKGHRKLTFLPADTLKDKVNEAFAMFEPVEVNDDYVDDVSNVEPEFTENDAVNDIQETDMELQHEGNDDADAVDVNSTIVAELQTENDSNAKETLNGVMSESEGNVDEEGEKCVEEQKSGNDDVNVADNRKSFVAYIVSVVLFVVIGVGVYLFFNDRDVAPDNNTKFVEKNEQTVVTVDNSAVVADSVYLHKTNVVEIKDTEENTPFVLLEELKQTPLSTITLKDTLLYSSAGNMAVHKVGIDETLTKIALKYYNDKKLWPYIVKYNNMNNHNQLEIGMELLIPKLVPRK